MEIVNNIAVRFECPSDIAQTIKSYIERSEVLDEKDGIADVVVHWGLDEMQRLSYLTPPTIKVPSPIERDYAWPGMFQPFNHQKDTSRFLTLNKRSFCFNEAGTGKTSSTKDDEATKERNQRAFNTVFNTDK